MANIGYMQLVRHCNQYCRFCSNPETGWTLDLATAQREVDDFVARGYFGVILTGGEPSLSPIVPEITRYARDRGLHVRMITNGSKIADADTARRFVEAGLLHYHVSIHSCREGLEDFLTGVRGSYALAMRALENLSTLDAERRAQGLSGVTVNINTVINAFNADHLDENVRAWAGRFPFLRHFVWNNLDPSMGRAETNRDTAHRLRDFEVSLSRAMRWLDRSGRTFRVERVPLCFMVEYAHASTETRKIIKGEERIVHFLDEKGTVRQTDFRHEKAPACESCTLEPICGGLFELGDWYDLAELAPVFVPKEPIVRRVLEEEDGSSHHG
jgi:MoaA/NifB/PqqE/SkfB family radical SAM enzyme